MSENPGAEQPPVALPHRTPVPPVAFVPPLAAPAAAALEVHGWRDEVTGLISGPIPTADMLAAAELPALLAADAMPSPQKGELSPEGRAEVAGLARAAEEAGPDAEGADFDADPTEEPGGSPGSDLLIPRPRADGLPQLVHAGTYALYLTPAGQWHCTYRRTAAFDPETDTIRPVEGAPDIHLRDLPDQAATMIMAVMDRDTTLPPFLEQMIMGGGKPPSLPQLLKMMRGAGVGEQLAAMLEQEGGGNGPG